MELLLVFLVGILYSAGIYLILRRSMVKLLLGFMMLGNGANILIFLMGELSKGKAPIIDGEESQFTDVYADPVPQALILTAIVISFGLTAFAIILLKKVHATTGTDDLDSLNVQDLDI
ncbi:Na+/H+ antiporter subunit C [Myroides pelagicus]|uniref:Na+/H+ antiporter subunit C n=1 Tax=Myroides pelagicus TaxID=270914 RepID=A0A7K1GIM7_9FLAO|nr:Na+/H+ antiporter subunit C [Myroides pelagicus]MEC4114471.1 Na+/H+ antiporter subunit C [Myroides pelagicus]MTH28752.1 Na+/H+ antiporter subunit C [Myroides pelagicus]